MIRVTRSSMSARSADVSGPAWGSASKPGGGGTSSFSVNSSNEESRQRFRRSSVSAMRTAILWTQVVNWLRPSNVVNWSRTRRSVSCVTSSTRALNCGWSGESQRESAYGKPFWMISCKSSRAASRAGPVVARSESQASLVLVGIWLNYKAEIFLNKQSRAIWLVIVTVGAEGLEPTNLTDVNRAL